MSEPVVIGMEADRADRFHDVARQSMKAFQAGDFEAATVAMRHAAEIAAPEYRLVQMDDGALQCVPVEG